MKDYRFHTPDGISDILPWECVIKKDMEKRLRVLFDRHGYLEVETPCLEFLDVYAGSGFVSPENMYKLTDGAGRLLALRYDGTVPAARVAATLMREEPLPLRISYIENMFRFHESGGGRQREFTQGGVELLGAALPEADGEVISLAILAAREVGIRDMQISLGQVDFFLGLMEEWDVQEEDAREISGYIDRKDTVALETAADRCHLREADKETLLLLPSLFGTFDVLDAFSARVKGKRALAALSNLREILEILEDFDCLSYVSVDLGMLPGLDYYTGMIFKGFTYEIGFPIFSGGRYNHVVASFGYDVPAVGFSMGINLCLTALRRQKNLWETTGINSIIGYEKDRVTRRRAAELLNALRQEGKVVLLDCEGMEEEALRKYARQKGIGEVIFLRTPFDTERLGKNYE